MDIFDRVADFANATARPLISIVLISFLSWGFMVQRIEGDVYAPLVAVVVGYWFGKVDANRDQQAVATRAAQQVVAEVGERRGTGSGAEHRRADDA